MNSKQQRLEKIESIKTSLRAIKIISKNSIQIEAKEEKIRYRRQSLQLAGDFLSEHLLRKFSDQDEEEQRNCLSSFNEKYRLLSKIGQGANAMVRTCEYVLTGKVYAVKIITMDDQHILELKKNFLNIKSLRHPSIIRYHALYFDLLKHVAYLVMEYFPFPNLIDQELSNEEQLRTVFSEVLTVISFIHERNICHRDIKPENILFDPITKRVKLIDFGISKRTYLRGQRRDMLTIIGTSQYLAPEILTGGGYDERVDLWSTGVTLYRMITGSTPFEAIYHSETISNIIKGKITFPPSWDKYSYFVKDLILRLLKPREQRLSAKEALSHLWISQSSPGRPRKRSEIKDISKFPRNQSFSFRLFEVYRQQQNLKHAKHKEEGEKQYYISRRFKPAPLHLIENKQFALDDSGEDEGSPTTSSTSNGPSKNKEAKWILL